MRPWLVIVITLIAVGICFAIANDATAADCPTCCKSCGPAYALPIARTYRGAALAQRRAQTGLYFRWLPGDALRGRSVLYVPSQTRTSR